MTPKKYDALVEKFYASPNNVRFSELVRLLELHGKKFLNKNSTDYYYGDPENPVDSIMIAKQHGTKDGVKRCYVTKVRNYLNLRENKEEMMARLELLRRLKQTGEGDNYEE